MIEAKKQSAEPHLTLEDLKAMREQERLQREKEKEERIAQKLKEREEIRRKFEEEKEKRKKEKAAVRMGGKLSHICQSLQYHDIPTNEALKQGT